MQLEEVQAGPAAVIVGLGAEEFGVTSNGTDRDSQFFAEGEAIVKAINAYYLSGFRSIDLSAVGPVKF